MGGEPTLIAGMEDKWAHKVRSTKAAASHRNRPSKWTVQKINKEWVVNRNRHRKKAHLLREKRVGRWIGRVPV